MPNTVLNQCLRVGCIVGCFWVCFRNDSLEIKWSPPNELTAVPQNHAGELQVVARHRHHTH